MFFSSAGLPRSAFSAPEARIGVIPTLVSAIPTFLQLLPSSVTCAATAAAAKSPTLRSTLKYAPPLRAGGMGTRISVRISLAASAVVKRPVKKPLIGIVRDHFDPQREHRRRVIVGRIGMRQVPSHRCPVAHQRIADDRSRVGDDRIFLSDQ